MDLTLSHKSSPLEVVKKPEKLPISCHDSDGNLSTLTRKFFRTVYKTELIHYLTKKLDLDLRYGNTEEDSNDDGYDYASQRMSWDELYF